MRLVARSFGCNSFFKCVWAVTITITTAVSPPGGVFSEVVGQGSAVIKSESLEVIADRKIISYEMIDNELRDYSTRLSNWRNKHNWKYFAEGGERSYQPFKD